MSEEWGKMAKGPFIIALIAAIGMILAGASPWLALAILLLWWASLYLARPAHLDDAATLRPTINKSATLAASLDPVDAPLLLIDAKRIIAANRAAQKLFGAHIVDQDVRVALRHPSAIALLNGETDKAVVVEGIAGPRSLFEIQLHRVDRDFQVIQLTDRSRESDVSRAHTDFVANASHELRTPLASIIGYAETLRDDNGGMDTATRHRFLDIILRESHRMRALIEDLMSLSRIEAEKHQRPAERVDLVPIVQAISRDVASIHGDDRIHCAMDAPTAPIFGDHAQIDQLIRNLVDNALKYGGTDEAVTLRIAADDKAVLLTVTDQGPGIDPHHLPHLTRRFYRTDPGRSQAAGGTGLGLAIVKHIVERHRATLDIDSKLGEGTSVTVRFPIALEMTAKTNYDKAVTELS